MGARLNRVIFTWLISMAEELEAKPSMDGAVPMMALFLPSALPTTLQMSFTTPLPTPRIRSQEGS